MEERLEWIQMDQVRLHPRARLHDPTKLSELMESLRLQGQLQPCRGRPAEGHIELYIGQGRYLAAQSLGWQKIQVLIGEKTDEEIDLAMLHENLKREDLDPVTEAREYSYLMETRDWTQGQLAERVGKSQEVISRTLSILSLAEEVKDIMRRRIISKHHGIILSKLADKGLQREVARAVCEGGLSVKQTEDLVNLCRQKEVDSADLPAALSELWSEKTYLGRSSQKATKTGPPSSVELPRSLPVGHSLSLLKLWPGLPAGVFARIEGGWLVLRCSRFKHSNLKSLFEALSQSAPEKLPHIQWRRKKKKVSKAAITPPQTYTKDQGSIGLNNVN